jgi:hypothetical protein
VSVIARSLDDLDRLAFRLSRTVRTQHPQLLTQGFTLTDLEERLLPYRDVRREMADGGAEAFESAVLRLVAGERGYVVADAALQAACRQALFLPSPTLALIRTWTNSVLHLNRTSGGTPAAGAAVVGATGAGAAPTGVAVAAAAPATRAETAPESYDVFPPRGTSAATLLTGAPADAMPVRARGVGDEGAPPAPHTTCRFCSGRLPNQRRVTFCPHCGLDLTKRQCAACSTELEVHWRFCVTCGRSEG